MARDANFRLNPFTEVLELETIANEPQTVALIEEIGIYGFVLDEYPNIEPAGDTLAIFEDVPGGAQWTEIDPGLDPNPGEYRVDKTHDTGVVELNALDDGRNFVVSYSGKGSIVNLRNLETDTIENEFFVGGLGVAGYTEDGRAIGRRAFSGSMPSSTRFGTVGHSFPASVFNANQDGFCGATSQLGQSSFPETITDGRAYYESFTIRPNDIYIFLVNGKQANWQIYFSLDYFL